MGLEDPRTPPNRGVVFVERDGGWNVERLVCSYDQQTAFATYSAQMESSAFDAAGALANLVRAACTSCRSATEAVFVSKCACRADRTSKGSVN